MERCAVRRFLAWLIVFAMVATACSSGDEAGDTTTAPGDITTSTTAATTTTNAPTTTTTSAPETTEAPQTTVAPSEEILLASTDLGDIITDGSGATLYLFLPDEQGESVCYDQCEAAWPPLVATTTAGDGLDPSLLGTVERTDGSAQVTYNGWPLYYFANDLEPGETNGQGVNEVWYVVDANGEPIR